MSQPSPRSAPPAAPEVPRPALVLGFAGLVPFILCGLGVWLVPPPASGFLHTVLIAYGMVIAAFMAGAQWGFGSAPSLDDGQRWRILGMSVVPALVVWIGAFSPFPWPHAFLLVAFAMVLRFDLKLVREGLAPPWYPQLRFPLTAAVGVSIGSALLHGFLARGPAA